MKLLNNFFSKNKINGIFKIIEEPGNENLNQSTDAVQTLLNDELKIVIITAIATLKRKAEKCGS